MWLTVKPSDRIATPAPGSSGEAEPADAGAVREMAPREIGEMLREHVVGRIGCHADGVTYVVPVIYAFEEGAIYVASLDGRKIELMRKNPAVCFEIDEYEGAGRWRSVIAQGVYEELREVGAEQALAALRRRFASTGRQAPARRPVADGRPTVCFRIAVTEATGRVAGR